MALKFADGSSGKRKDGVEIDSRYDNKTDLRRENVLQSPNLF